MVAVNFVRLFGSFLRFVYLTSVSDNGLNDLNVFNFLTSPKFYIFRCAKLISSTKVGK